MKNQLFVSQLVGDLLFPFLGYFLWDWSLYFILLFVILDLLCDLIVNHFKAHKIYQFQEQKSWPIFPSIIAVLLFGITIVLLHLLIFIHQPAVNFLNEIVLFWNYKDMGIAQGYLLAPLLILMAMQQYRIEFSMPALYRTQTQQQVWTTHFKSYFWLLAFAGIGTGQVVLLQVNEFVLFLLLCLVLLIRAISTRFA